MKKKITIVIMAIALLSAGAVGIDQAYAYFTTYAQASGSQEVTLGDETTIKEELVDGNKEVTLTNKATSKQAVYVRARAFAGSEIAAALEYTGTGWNKGEGDWYYYSKPLLPGETAEPLLIEVNGRPADEETLLFKVTVVYESVPAVQNGEDADGNILYEPAEWSKGGEQ